MLSEETETRIILNKLFFYFTCYANEVDILKKFYFKINIYLQVFLGLWIIYFIIIGKL